MDLMIEDDFVLPDNPDAPLCVGSSLPWLFDKGEVDGKLYTITFPFMLTIT
jgi:hypothetical protein